MYICRIILWISTITRKKGSIILMYHSIGPDSDIRIFPDNKVSPGNFERQIRYMARKRKLISLAAFLDYARKKSKRLKDSVVITFDDGYLDNCRTAMPILKKHKLPATFFIATGMTGGASVFDKLNYVVMTTERDRVTIPLSDGVSKEASLATSEDRYDFVCDTARLMRDMSFHQQMDFLKSISAELHGDDFNVEQCNPRTMMSWEDCKAMSKYDRFCFGAHGVSHENLARMPPDTVQKEMINSKEQLEKCIGQQIRFFAYPYGYRSSYNDDIIRVLKQNGFECGLTSEPGVNNGNDDLFRLKRVAAVNDGGLLFRFTLLGRDGVLGRFFRRVYVYHDN